MTVLLAAHECRVLVDLDALGAEVRL